MCDCNKLFPDGAMSTSNGRPASRLSGTTIRRFLGPSRERCPKTLIDVGGKLSRIVVVPNLLQETFNGTGDDGLRGQRNQAELSRVPQNGMK
jgi:hypothetical protein